MGPYRKDQDSDAIDDGWTITDGDGGIIAHLDTETMTDALLAALNGNTINFPKPSAKKLGKVKEGLRAFVGSFFICVDDTENVAPDDKRRHAATVKQVAKFIKDAVELEVNLDFDTVGFQSVEIHGNTVRELTEEEMKLYYGH